MVCGCFPCAGGFSAPREPDTLPNGTVPGRVRTLQGRFPPSPCGYGCLEGRRLLGAVGTPTVRSVDNISHQSGAINQEGPASKVHPHRLISSLPLPTGPLMPWLPGCNFINPARSPTLLCLSCPLAHPSFDRCKLPLQPCRMGHASGPHPNLPAPLQYVFRPATAE